MPIVMFNLNVDFGDFKMAGLNMNNKLFSDDRIPDLCKKTFIKLSAILQVIYKLCNICNICKLCNNLIKKLFWKITLQVIANRVMQLISIIALLSSILAL